MRKTVWALGVGAAGTGYPNGAAFIALLSRDPEWQVEDRVRWLPADVHLWRLGKGPLLGRLRILFHIARRVAFLPFDLIKARRGQATVYTPYPALFTLAVARCLPRSLRPRVVADVFISVWDSGFADRKIAPDSTRLAGAVKAIEAWCLRAADAVLADTVENAAFLQQEFAIEKAKVHVMPLAMDAGNLLALAPTSFSLGRPLRVLYVGTFVPLHGFPVIIEAMRNLNSADGIEFRIVGDGQHAPLLEAAMREGFRCRVEWVREWQSAGDLVAHYAWSDVCLGVFGAGGKASRVLPFKVYAALAAGRAVVTQEQMGSPTEERPPVESCIGTAGSLADTLRELSKHPGKIQELVLAGRPYFSRTLSDAAILRAWSSIRQACSQS